MLLLAATIVANTSFALILRAAQRRHANDMAVGTINYVVASMFFGILAAISRPDGATTAATYALAGGSFNVIIYLLLLPAMRLRGVAISIAMVRLAVVIPLAAAILVWNEAPSFVQTYGILLALVAVPMLTLDKGISDQPLTVRRIAVLLGLLLSNGMTLLMLKAFQMTGFTGARPIYLGVVFAIGAVVCAIAWLRGRKAPLSALEIKWGILLGTSNALTNILMFATLDVLLASVMFPILAAAGLSLSTIFAAIAWREIPGKLGWAGIAVAVVAVVLTNL